MRSVPFEGTCCGYSSSYFYFFSTFPNALAQRTMIWTTEKEGAPSTDEAMECRENSRGILVRTCRRSAGAGFHQHRLGGATLCVGIQRSFDVFGETFNALRWETHLVIITLLQSLSLSLCLYDPLLSSSSQNSVSPFAHFSRRLFCFSSLANRFCSLSSFLIASRCRFLAFSLTSYPGKPLPNA